jgi:3-hydroxyisobutyrate dehydrogenase-like beta-hydroxyacid dehydrogenase
MSVDQTLFSPGTIALLGLGEAGNTIAAGLCAPGGWRDSAPERRVIAIDIALDDGKRGVAMRAHADSLGVPIAPNYTDALAPADLVISVVTGKEARAAACMAQPWLRAGALYADVNSITGPETRAVAAELTPHGIDFVDVAAVGIFKATGLKTPTLLAGPCASELAAFAAAIDMPAKILSDGIGDASAVKILRSVLMKGLEALSVECLVAARRQGLVSEVLNNLGDVDALGFSKFVQALTITHLVHAKRRKEEMDKAASNLVETGVPPLMTDATRRNHQRTIDAALDGSELTGIDLDTALKILDEDVVGTAQ